MSHERISVWDDPEVKRALAEGRAPSDVCILNCPQCGKMSYYNQGSSFYCRHCDEGYYAAHADELPLECDYVLIDEVYTLDDATDAECADYP